MGSGTSSHWSTSPDFYNLLWCHRIIIIVTYVLHDGFHFFFFVLCLSNKLCHVSGHLHDEKRMLCHYGRFLGVETWFSSPLFSISYEPNNSGYNCSLKTMTFHVIIFFPLQSVDGRGLQVSQQKCQNNLEFGRTVLPVHNQSWPSMFEASWGISETHLWLIEAPIKAPPLTLALFESPTLCKWTFEHELWNVRQCMGKESTKFAYWWGEWEKSMNAKWCVCRGSLWESEWPYLQTPGYSGENTGQVYLAILPFLFYLKKKILCDTEERLHKLLDEKMAFKWYLLCGDCLPGSSAYLKLTTLSRLLAFKKDITPFVAPTQSYQPCILKCLIVIPISISVKAS